MEVILPRSTTLDTFGLIKYYFEVKPNLKYKDICTIINDHHGMSVTLRKLKEIFKKNGFNRKRNVDNATLEAIITNELGINYQDSFFVDCFCYFLVCFCIFIFGAAVGYPGTGAKLASGLLVS